MLKKDIKTQVIFSIEEIFENADMRGKVLIVDRYGNTYQPAGFYTDRSISIKSIDTGVVTHLCHRTYKNYFAIKRNKAWQKKVFDDGFIFFTDKQSYVFIYTNNILEFVLLDGFVIHDVIHVPLLDVIRLRTDNKVYYLIASLILTRDTQELIRLFDYECGIM